MEDSTILWYQKRTALIGDLCISEDSTTLYATGQDGVIVYSLKTGRVMSILPKDRMQWYEACAVTRDGRYLWVGNKSARGVDVLRTSDWEVMARIFDKTMNVTLMDLAEDGHSVWLSDFLREGNVCLVGSPCTHEAPKDE